MISKVSSASWRLLSTGKDQECVQFNKHFLRAENWSLSQNPMSQWNKYNCTSGKGKTIFFFLAREHFGIIVGFAAATANSPVGWKYSRVIDSSDLWLLSALCDRTEVGFIPEASLTENLGDKELGQQALEGVLSLLHFPFHASLLL